MLNVPNTLTLLRIAAVPALLICVTYGRYGWALALFLAAGLTDAVDGAVARLTDAHTPLGASIDPLADKLLLVSSFVLLAWKGAVPSWLAILVVTRDAVILGGYLAISVLSRPIEVRPSALGKTNTFFQLITVGFALVSLARPDLPLDLVNSLAHYATGATTAASGLHYIYRTLGS